MKEELKAVLLLDNCSAHPRAFDVTSNDGKIIAYFLPANVISLIQPIDQGNKYEIRQEADQKADH